MTGKSVAQHGLEKKYSSLLGEFDGVRSVLATAREAASSIPHLEERERGLQNQLKALEESIRLFSPNWSSEGWKSTKPNKRRNALSWNAPARHAMAMLHTRPEGFTTGEMIADLCRLHKLGPIPDGMRESFRAAIDLSMKRKERDGLVIGVGRRPRRWCLVPTSSAPQRASKVDFDA